MNHVFRFFFLSAVLLVGSTVLRAQSLATWNETGIDFNLGGNWSGGSGAGGLPDSNNIASFGSHVNTPNVTAAITVAGLHFGSGIPTGSEYHLTSSSPDTILSLSRTLGVVVAIETNAPIVIDAPLRLTAPTGTSLTFRSTSGSGYTLTLNGVVSSTESPTVNFVSLLGRIVVNGANTYTGPTQLLSSTDVEVSSLADGGQASSIGASDASAGNLSFGNGSRLIYTGGATSTDRLFTLLSGGGQIDADGSGAIAFTNPGAIGFAGGGVHPLTLGGGSSGSLAALLSDASGAQKTLLAKNGTGTWTLSGANTYTGGTNIVGGTLVVAAGGTDSALGTGNVTVQTNGTLAGGGHIGGNAIVSGKLSPGGAGVDSLTFDQNLTLQASSMTLFDITDAANYDRVFVTGIFTPGGTLSVTFGDGFEATGGETFSLISGGTFGEGAFAGFILPTLSEGLSWDTSALATTGALFVSGSAIPEPATSALVCGAVLLGFALGRRKRRRDAASVY